MINVTINSRAGLMADIVASMPGAVLGLVWACRSATALAMMSERELDDLGLLPWEVRSEDWQKDSTAALQCLVS